MRAKIQLYYPNSSGVTEFQTLNQVLKSDPNNAKVQTKLDDYMESMRVPVAGMDLFQFAWDVYTRTDTTKWENLYYYSMYTGNWFTGEELCVLNQVLSVITEEIDKKK